ncbi:MAG TPA: hypothetical protein VFR85_11130 [Anaeromyxobacteraceae bacterium]|nr:hypothetical protein [Anaeromyxobacteraceae bacterium]
MPLDPEQALALLRDPGVGSEEVAAAAGVSREQAAAAARLVSGIATARPEDVAALPPALGAAVARTAAAAGRADLLAALAAHPVREIAKEAKRGLHLLRSRGLPTPEPARAPPPRAPARPEPDFPCFASAVDGQGEQVVWIARSVPGRGVEVGQAVVSDVLGLLELQTRLLGRKEFRALARDLAEKGRDMSVAEVGAGRARALVAQARALNESSGRPLPDGAEAWLGRLGPPAPPEDLGARFPPLPDEEERAALEGSGALHQLPVLRGWLADEDLLRQLAQKLDEIAVSPLYLDERQKAEQAARVLSEAIESWLDEPRRRRLSTRLLATAAHLELLGDLENARLAGAAARAVAAGLPASRIPFARLLVEKAFPARPPAPAPRPSDPLILAPR